MRSWNDENSPFRTRLYFEADEFESMMDDLERRAGEEVFSGGSGVDVDLVALRGFGIEADYVELPIGVLGRTLFGPGGEARIEIARELSDAAEWDMLSRRRFRTTLAHEIGYVSCHSQLFVRDTSTSWLFPELEVEANKSRILCRESDVGRLGYCARWWEYQANQCMASLLLPRKLFEQRVREELVFHGCRSFESAIRRRVDEDLIRALSDWFDVSHEAVLYRLKALGFVVDPSKPRLNFRN